MSSLEVWILETNVIWRFDDRGEYTLNRDKIFERSWIELVFREGWIGQYYFPTNTADVLSALNVVGPNELIGKSAKWDITWYGDMGHPDTLIHDPAWRMGYVKITEVWGTEI